VADDNVLRRHALTAVYRERRFGREPDAPAVTLTVRPRVNILSLRGRAGDAQFVAAAGHTCGAALPLVTGSSVPAGAGHLLALSPTEWWLVTNSAPAVEASTVRTVDLSEGRTVIRLAGPRAREVLAKGCGLDLHPRAFAAGRCAQTPIAHIGMLLHRVDDGAWDLYVPRSYARHFWEWLTEAAAEFGGAVLKPLP
jgi:sarcosine oxidase subunit gamma